MAENRWTSDLHRRKQARSGDTQTKLLDAAEMLIDRQGSDAVAVTEIAAKAGVSIGSLYHQFTDKAGLLDALFCRILDQMEETCTSAVEPARWEGASVRDILQAILSFSIETAPEGTVKAAKLIAISSNDTYRTRYFDILSDLFAGFLQLIMARRTEIGHPKPKEAAGFVLDQMSALIFARLDPTYKGSLLVAKSEKQFLRHSMTAAVGYLQLS